MTITLYHLYYDHHLYTIFIMVFFCIVFLFMAII